MTLVRTITKPWAPEILVALTSRACRFNRLAADLGGLADRTLFRRLVELQDAGLVERLVDCGPPIRVSYQLTAAGGRAARAVQQLTLLEEVG